VRYSGIDSAEGTARDFSDARCRTTYRSASDCRRHIGTNHEGALAAAASGTAVSVFFALLAALSNALNVITQHIASTSDTEGAKGWRLVGYLLRNPLWLFGWVALICAFVFQALALHNGPLSSVQTLLMTELVFALVLRRVWLGQTIRSAAWLSAALTCVSISVFIVVAEPRGGSSSPSSHAWASSIILCGGASALLVLFALRGSPARRAALFATAAGIVWGLEATFIKTTTDVLTQYGLGGLFARWPVYAVAVTGAVGVVIMQSALHVGPLRVSQPLLVIVDPLVSIALGVHLYGERFTDSPTDLTLGAIAFVAMCLGVLLLTRTVPESTERRPKPARSQH
jgi:drug/metabolite transporter (DMT)-like permease